MRRGGHRLLLAALLTVGGAPGCNADEALFTEAQQTVASDRGTLLTFSFDASVLVRPGGASAEESIARQLLYTIGQLNGAGGVSSPATARVSNIERAHLTAKGSASLLLGGPDEIRYHAELPVAWPSQDALPSTYRLKLPFRVDEVGESLLLHSSSYACFDTLSESEPWYDYRPDDPGCSVLIPLSQPVAAVTPSPLRSSGRAPEQQRIWEDGALSVLAIFRKDTPGSTSGADIGRVAFVDFVAALRAALGPESSVLLNPGGGSPHLPAPGLEPTDLTLSRTYPDGRRVDVVVLLEDVVAAPSGPAFLGGYTRFLRRYAELGPTADLVLYNGHSGLGENIRAISDHSSFLPGKYQIMYLDTCDSFAYVSANLPLSRRTPGDPAGTRNLDIIVNSMPATFAGMPAAAMALVGALLPGAEPQRYEDILAGFDPSRVGFVLGDEDNRPSPPHALPQAPVYSRRGEATPGAALSLQTPLLPAGDYALELGPDWARGGPSSALSLSARTLGSPDLAAEPRCQRSSSLVGPRSARCAIHLPAPAMIALEVRGDAKAPFALTGFAVPKPPLLTTIAESPAEEEQ